MPRFLNEYEAAKAQGRLWTPDMAKGRALKAWFTAKSGIGYSSGVSTWRDQSGNGLNAAQATAAERPGYLATGWNGALPALQFISDNTANSDDMSVSGLTTGVCGGRPAIFAVVKPNTFGFAASCACWRGTTAATGLAYYNVTNFGFTFNDSSSSWGYAGAPAVTTNRTLWGMWVPDSNTGHVIVNGSFYTASGGGTFTAPTSGTDLVLGQDVNDNARHYDGLIAAIAVFDGTQLTRLEVDRIAASLMWEWQIQASLPASSAYKNRPPLIGG